MENYNSKLYSISLLFNVKVNFKCIYFENDLIMSISYMYCVEDVKSRLRTLSYSLQNKQQKGKEENIVLKSRCDTCIDC